MAELDLVGKVVTLDASAHAAGYRRAPRVGERRGPRHDDQGEPTQLAGRGATRSLEARQPSTAEYAEYTEHSRGHGRTEERIVRATALTAQMPIDFPHAAQIFRVIRYVGGLDGQPRSKEIAHCITSLTTNKASAPNLARLLRDHGGAIENKTH